MKKKTLAMALLSAVLLAPVFLFAGCSSGSAENMESGPDKEEEISYIYVLEDLDWGLEEGDSDSGYYSSYGCFNHQIFRTYTVYDVDGDYVQLQVLNLDSDSVQTIEYKPDANSYISSAAIIPEGDSAGFALLETYYDEETHYGVKLLDGNGAVVGEFLLDDLMSWLEEKYGYAYISEMVFGTDGYIYLGSESDVIVLDTEGVRIAQIEIPNWLNSLGLSGDGRVYATYYDSGYQLAFIDLETETLQKLDFGVTSFSSGTVNVLEDGSVVYGDSSGLNMYRYDAQTGETEVLFDWVSLDVVGYNVDAVYYLDEDNLVVKVYDYAANSYSDTMARVVRRESSEVAEKTILTLALFSTDSDTQEYVVAFNKANDQYRIEIKTYLDYTTIDYNNYMTYYEDAVTRMQNDLVSGEGADIIMLTDYGVSAGTLIGSGRLEDLFAFLDERGYTGVKFVTQVYDALMAEG
ncbi:MAG: hypothetical protein LUE87_12695, partial [Lachnospiraceae bacterium]|nr:hypothetical protein [Lachnospiraceae bacterium]